MRLRSPRRPCCWPQILRARPFPFRLCRITPRGPTPAGFSLP